MKHAPIHCALVLFACSALTAPDARAQWSSDPLVNASVADGASDQTQPKLVATTDGGTFLSWFDGIGNGYDVRVQRFDQDGAEVFAHNGVLVANRSFSSTQDYGFSIAENDDALVAFRDDRLVGVQISAARITGAGAMPWGALGVQLTNTTGFVANPKIAGTRDGGAVVAWTQDATVRVQKLDAAGVPQWASDVVFTPAAGSYSTADLIPDGFGAIVSMVHQTGGFTSPRRLVTQKLDGSGASQWGATPLQVFDTGSVQIGNFPPFTGDGAGGAVFSWYTTSPLQCFAQHILSNGSEAFPHNGVAVSTNATRIRVSPWASFVPETGETIVSWQEQNSLQSMSGLWSQKLDAAGNRLWGNEGTMQIALSNTQIGNIRNLAGPYVTDVYYVSTPSFGQGVVEGLRLDSAGATVVASYGVSTTPSTKSRLAAIRNGVGQSILAWMDDQVDSGDIFAQDVNCDATLGAPDLTAPWTDLGNALAGSNGLPMLTGSGTLCEGADVTLTLLNAKHNSIAALILGASNASLPLLGGTLVPSPDVVVAGIPTGPVGFVSITAPLPVTLPPGFSFYVQYWIVDAFGPAGAAASNALQATAP